MYQNFVVYRGECEERSAGIEGRTLCLQPTDLNTEIFLKNAYFLGIGFDRINIYGVGGAGWLFCTEGPQ